MPAIIQTLAVGLRPKIVSRAVAPEYNTAADVTVT
jgi:hypothetical protein